MYVDLDREQLAFRDELREYFEGMMTAELQDELRGSEGGGPLYREALQQMGRDKLLGVGWPEEYGGRGLGSVEQFIYSDEVQRAGYPLPFLTLNTVGPTLMHFGSDDQRKEFLPRILAGELHFAIGYSEPSAGTDLASLQMRPAVLRHERASLRVSVNFFRGSSPSRYSSGCSCLIFRRCQRLSTSISVASSWSACSGARICFVLPIFPSQSPTPRRLPIASGS